MRRLLKRVLVSLTVATVVVVITVGLINTYLGVESPLRTGSARVVSMLPFLPPLVERLSQSADATAMPSDLLGRVGEAAWHQSVDESERICAAPAVSEVAVWSERTAYTWVDEDGVRSFGDEAPASLPKQVIAMDEGDRQFSIKIVWDGLSPKRSLEGQLRAGATRIYERWGVWIGPKALVRSHINVRITANRTQFIRRWNGDADGPIPSGFYSLARNEAVVLYKPKSMSDERLLEVAFHEVAHLVTTWQVGQLPPWYSEGLAEYFETMQVQWQSASYRTREAWRDRAARSGLMPLSKLLILSPREWFTDDIARRYSTAGALIAFLSSTDRGRELLTTLARNAHKARCASRESKSDWGLDEYPGGVRALDRELRTWLQ